VPAAVEVGTGTGKEDERGRAEVGDPAGEEDARGGTAGWHAGVDSDVIDRHQDHHGAPDQIDGRDP
jgi:hypothetical protein